VLSGTDESALVGQDDGLRAVVQPELAEYPADVDAHGALGDGQLSGDAVVGKPAGEHEEHLALDRNAISFPGFPTTMWPSGASAPPGRHAQS